jgi:hypothetical protein
MKLLTNFINHLFVKEPVVLLGRWNIVYCEKKINKKIDLSNEDHCGTCSSYDIIAPIEKKNETKNYNLKSLIFFETM